jgi:hypothetical protein
MKEENAGRKCIRVSLGQQYVKVKAYSTALAWEKEGIGYPQ